MFGLWRFGAVLCCSPLCDFVFLLAGLRCLLFDVHGCLLYVVSCEWFDVVRCCCVLFWCCLVVCLVFLLFGVAFVGCCVLLCLGCCSVFFSRLTFSVGDCCALFVDVACSVLFVVGGVAFSVVGRGCLVL